MPSADLLVIDIGNTQLKLGFYAGATLLGSERVASSTNQAEMTASLRALLGAHVAAPAMRIVVASVAPKATIHCRLALLELTGITALEIPLDLPAAVENRASQPAQVGIDRLLNAVAARHLHTGSVIVVDFGTAMTLDVISPDGAYLGGVIAPGMRLSLASLNERTALLPRVELDFVSPPILGTDTLSAMQSGVFWGCVGSVKELVGRMRKHLGGGPLVLATGGYAEIIAKEAGCIDRVVPALTLEGMRLSLLAHDQKS